MNKLYFLLICWVFLCPVSKSQTLTQTQMREDINFLQSHIHQYFSPLPLLEQRTGISVNDEYDKLKKKVTGVKSVEEFVEIIRQGLNILSDGHTGLQNSQRIKWYVANSYLSPLSNVSLTDTLHADYYFSLENDSIYSRVKCGFWPKYINGKYYIFRSFAYNGVSIKAGAEIKAVDGVAINRFIQEHRSQLYRPMWDVENKQWFDEYFIFAMPLIGKSKFSLTFDNQLIDFDSAKPLENLQPLHPQNNSPKMAILNNDILYIYMPSMMDANWYINELLRIYISNVKKIVIDIRSNSGGDDSVWARLLRKILDKPLTYTYRVGVNHKVELEKAISSFGKIKVNGNTAVLTNNVTLLPDSNSVHFKGKIYVLQNRYTYSAASALSSLAMQSSNMQLVGEPSALISGYTFPAILFKLPNSGIVFSLAFSSDLTGGKGNPYMDKVNVNLELNINEHIDKVQNNDYHSDNYLMNKDKLIHYVRTH